MVKAAFIGLGVMGHPMAGHLSKAGHAVTVYNRTQQKAESWVVEHGGASADTPAKTAEGADFVFVCVGNDDDVRSVTTAPGGVIEGLQAGAVLVDHTTASAGLAEELAAAAQAKGAGFLDAPVSGGQAGAENGQLTIMIGGAQVDFAKAEPIMDAYAKAQTLMGPVGAGQLTKMVNQICIGGLLQSLAEAVHFAQKAGLNTDKVFGAISKGAAQSWQMENRHQTMAAGEFDFGFAVDWMRKDLGIAMEQAQKIGAQLPLTQLVDDWYAEVQALGGNRWDTSSLLTRLNPPTK
ncbi:MAG: NAD(P)-dependent oxidoreductase [Alphaproteobacteria bacterium]